jgi:hypothetical protein
MLVGTRWRCPVRCEDSPIIRVTLRSSMFVTSVCVQHFFGSMRVRRRGRLSRRDVLFGLDVLVVVAQHDVVDALAEVLARDLRRSLSARGEINSRDRQDLV